MSSFRRQPDMFTPRSAVALLPHWYAYVPTTTCRDWSVFDAPAKTRMTARRIRQPNVLNIKRQAS